MPKMCLITSGPPVESIEEGKCRPCEVEAWSAKKDGRAEGRTGDLFKEAADEVAYEMEMKETRFEGEGKTQDEERKYSKVKEEAKERVVEGGNAKRSRARGERLSEVEAAEILVKVLDSVEAKKVLDAAAAKLQDTKLLDEKKEVVKEKENEVAKEKEVDELEENMRDADLGKGT